MFQDFIFHHIGIATPDIERTSFIYRQAKFHMTEIIADPLQNVNICFLSKKHHPLIELVSPLSIDSPVSKIIEKSGVTAYHMCYEVDDILESLRQLKQLKFVPLSKPVPAMALQNRLICFLYHLDSGLIELMQSK